MKKRAPRTARQPEALPPADDVVRREWLRRIEAEYRSGAHAQHLTLWLLQLAAPPELIEMRSVPTTLSAEESTDLRQNFFVNMKEMLTD